MLKKPSRCATYYCIAGNCTALGRGRRALINDNTRADTLPFVQIAVKPGKIFELLGQTIILSIYRTIEEG